MKTIKLASASRSFAEYAKELDDQIVVVTDRNKPVAAVVPLKNVDRESLALSSHPEFLEIMRSHADNSPLVTPYFRGNETRGSASPKGNKRMERTRKTRRSS